jgi:hypothetical protein
MPTFGSLSRRACTVSVARGAQPASVRRLLACTVLGIWGSFAAAQDAPLAFPWDTVVFDLIQPRYKVEAVRFKARDETGIDWPGSDEVMVEGSDSEGNAVTEEIENIDSGDTFDFEPGVSCIVGVTPGVVLLGKTSVCDADGTGAPVGFQVEIWEKDFGLSPVCLALPPAADRHAGPHCVNDGAGDDFIGRAQIDLSFQELQEKLPAVGDTLLETVVLSPCRQSETVCDVGSLFWDTGDYSFTYVVTRLPDARSSFQQELTAAMRRSGISLQSDAVIAGLQLLRTPGKRPVEPEPDRATPQN